MPRLGKPAAVTECVEHAPVERALQRIAVGKRDLSEAEARGGQQEQLVRARPIPVVARGASLGELPLTEALCGVVPRQPRAGEGVQLDRVGPSHTVCGSRASGIARA